MSQAGATNTSLVPITVLETLTGNTGGAIGPDGSHNINVVASNTNIVVGNPATNTLTITPTSQGYPITPYVVGLVNFAGYQTIQSAINAAHTAGGGTIYIQPGTYTENLTLFNKVDLWGAVGIADSGTCTIIGTHTPPISGEITIRNIFLQSATNIFSSSSAGTSAIILIDVAIKVTNGYTFNLPNWTSAGSFTGFDIGEIGSTNDGWINNTGGAFVFMTNATIGAGSSNTMITSGSSFIFGCDVQCPANFQTGASSEIDGGTIFNGTVTLSNNSTGTINNSTFITNSNSAIIINSSGNWTVSCCTINSSNNPCIAGTGAGILTLADITYINNSSIANTVTTGYTAPTEVGTLYAQNISFDRGSHTVSINGQLIIGNTGHNPSITTLTAGTGISIINGAGSITINSTGITTIDGDSGSMTPSSGVVTISGGTTGLTTSASSSTMDLTGTLNVGHGGTGATTLTGVLIGNGASAVTGNAITQYDVLVGGASNAISSVGPGSSGQILQSGGNAANPAYSTATYPSTTTINEILYSSSNNVVGQITTADNGVLITGTTGIPSILANSSTPGYVLTANTGAPPSWQATASTGITTIDGDSGSMTGSTVTISGGTTGLTTSASSATMDLTGTLVVGNGGTGATTLTGVLIGNGTSAVTASAVTQYDVLVGGASNAISSITPSTAQKFLVSNGTSANPSFKSLSVVNQTFTSTGTYTPTSGMVYCIIECLGGGGAGGGAAATSGTASCGAGGGSGEYAQGIFSAATIGSSQSVTIGSAGTGVSGTTGNGGGNTSVGGLISANGGSGGTNFAATGSAALIFGSAGGTGGSGGSFRTPGQYGGDAANTTGVAYPGAGGSSQFGAGGNGSVNASPIPGLGYGAGGAGAANNGSQSARAGGAGTAGVVIVTEYVIS